MQHAMLSYLLFPLFLYLSAFPKDKSNLVFAESTAHIDP